jgi:hypothetical protein
MNKLLIALLIVCMPATAFCQYKLTGIESSLMPYFGNTNFRKDSLVFSSRRGSLKMPLSFRMPVLLRFADKNRKTAFLAGLSLQYNQLTIRRKNDGLFGSDVDTAFSLRKVTLQSSSVGVNFGFEYDFHAAEKSRVHLVARVIVAGSKRISGQVFTWYDSAKTSFPLLDNQAIQNEYKATMSDYSLMVMPQLAARIEFVPRRFGMLVTVLPLAFDIAGPYRKLVSARFNTMASVGIYYNVEN